MTPLLAIQHISKRFPGVQALSDVSFDILKGEVHALVGENGAGKSTLMKILSGVYRPDSGMLLWEGQRLELHNPADAQRKGISIIYQEFNLLPDLTVAENVLLNREPRTRFGLLDWQALNNRTAELLSELETYIDPQQLVSTLSVAQQQMVEIVKALAVDARLIIMDEPTATLNPVEVGHLFNVVKRLTERDTSVIFISHRLDEVLTIADRVTVMKDGQWVTTQPAAELTEPDIVRLMIGRDLSDIFPPKRFPAAASPLLEVRNLHTPRLSEVSFEIAAGEIVGCVGLEGHGQRQLVRALFGLEPWTRGEVRLNGVPVRLHNPRAAIKHGIAFISDDRKAEGLALRLGVRENVALPNLSMFQRGGITQPRQERLTIAKIVETLGVKTPALDQEVRLLSGGNQQKSVLAKWLIQSPRLLIFIEPTRGIDVGAKLEIYQLIHSLAAEGAGILFVSSELLEVLGLSHRVLVMRDGRLCADLPHDECTEERIMLAATGVEHGG
jgi:ribose transport system ATP-binding protein